MRHRAPIGGQAHSRTMNRTDVMFAVVEMVAGAGGALPATEAISHIAAFIDRLDKASESYQTDLEVLLSIGATIWTLAASSPLSVVTPPTASTCRR